MVSRETSERWETRKSSKEQTWAKNNGPDSVTVPVGINLSAMERKNQVWEFQLTWSI